MVSQAKYDAKDAVRVKCSKSKDFGEKFVKKYLLKYKPMHSYSANFGEAFADAESIIDPKEYTVIIFLTDGCSEDDGASEIVERLSKQMQDLLLLFCVTLGQNQNKKNKTVENIKKKTGKNGKSIKTLTGNELGNVYTSIARHINGGSGSFMSSQQ